MSANISLVLLSPSTPPNKHTLSNRKQTQQKSSLGKILLSENSKTQISSIPTHLETISSVVKLKDAVSFAPLSTPTVKYQINFNGQYLSQNEWSLFSNLLLSSLFIVKLDLGRFISFCFCIFCNINCRSVAAIFRIQY